MRSRSAIYAQKYVMHAPSNVKSFPLLKNANNALLHVEIALRNVVI